MFLKFRIPHRSSTEVDYSPRSASSTTSSEDFSFDSPGIYRSPHVEKGKRATKTRNGPYVESVCIVKKCAKWHKTTN